MTTHLHPSMHGVQGSWQVCTHPQTHHHNCRKRILRQTAHRVSKVVQHLFCFFIVQSVVVCFTCSLFMYRNCAESYTAPVLLICCVFRCLVYLIASLLLIKFHGTVLIGFILCCSYRLMYFYLFTDLQHHRRARRVAAPSGHAHRTPHQPQIRIGQGNADLISAHRHPRPYHPRG